MYRYSSIAISGNPVAGKSSLADRLSAAYGWTRLSIGGLQRQRWRKQHPAGDVPFEDWWRSTTIEDNREINALAKSTIENGGIVADSRFCNYLDSSRCLLVFLTADLGIRVLRAKSRGEYSGMDDRKLGLLLAQREQDELRMGRLLYGDGFDYRDPRIFHAVINTGLLTVEQEFLAIDSLIRDKQ